MKRCWPLDTRGTTEKVRRIGLRILAAVVVVALAGCARAPWREVLFPSFMSGEDAARKIDIQIAGMIVARHPGVPVGHARCPYLINLSAGQTGRCTLDVAGSMVRVDVHPLEWLSARDTLIVRRDAEREIADDLDTAYGVRFTVRCQGKALRIVSDGTTIRCAIGRNGAATRVIRVNVDDEHLSPIGPRNLRSLRERLLGPSARRAKNHFTIAGPQMERFIRATAGEEAHSELARRGLIHAAQCPARISLDDRDQISCSVMIGTHAMQYDVSFHKGKPLFVGSDKVAEVVPVARGLSQRYYMHVLPLIDRHVLPGTRVRSDCGRDEVFVGETHDEIRCTAHAGSTTFTFDIVIGDESDDFWFADDLAPE